MSAFLLCFTAFETIFMYFYKTELFWIKLILKKKTSNNYEKRGDHSVQQSFLKLCTKSQGKRANRSGTGARGT